MKNLSKFEMNAVVGGAKKTKGQVRDYPLTKPKEKAWYEEAWDEIKSWF